MNKALAFQAHAVATLGSFLLVVGWWVLPPGPHLAVSTAVVAGAAAALRQWQIPLTKYSSVHLLGPLVVLGILIGGVMPTAMGLALGVLLTDHLAQRKSLRLAWLNAGREALAVFVAFGAFAAAAIATDASTVGRLNEDLIPSVVLLLIAHFVVSRALQYFSLYVRDKLLAAERALILRFEVITWAAGSLAVAVILLTLALLSREGWPFVAAAVVVGGLLLYRILQETIASEEMNVILAMDQVIASDAPFGDALDSIGGLAYRLIDWQVLRVYRETGARSALVWEHGRGIVQPPLLASDAAGALRDEVAASAAPLVVPDAARDPRWARAWPDARSVMLAPLTFGDRVLGILEVRHEKPRLYRDKDRMFVTRVARQIATVLHIHDLRMPLRAAVREVTTELATLGESARVLRAGGESVARTAAELSRALGEQSELTTRSADAGAGLHDAMAGMVHDGGEAAAASGEASRLATAHRATIAAALERLVAAKGFVGESSQSVGDLATATRHADAVLEHLRSMAGQIDLLAVSATVEAARAGAHGRGFAVVAVELRRLAEQSSEAVEATARILAAIAGQGRAAAEQMERGRSLVRDVEGLSETAHAALERIVSATSRSADAASRTASVAGRQLDEVARLRERIARIAELARSNAAATSALVETATGQATALREQEGAVRALRSVATVLGELAHRLTNVR